MTYSLLCPRHRIICKIAVVVMCAIMLSQVPACKTLDQGKNAETHAALVQQRNELNASLGDPSLTAEQRARIEALIAKNEVALRDIEDAISDGNAAAGEPGRAIVEGITGAIPVWGGLATALVGVGYGVRRKIMESKAQEKSDEAEARRLAIKTAFEQSVHSIENAKAVVPAFAEAWNAAKLAVEAKQDEATKALVEQVKTASKS